MGIKLPSGYGLPRRAPRRAPWGAEDGEAIYCEDGDGSRSFRSLIDFSEPPDPPTSLWGSALQSGYQVVRCAEIEGIPYLLGERELWTVRDGEAGPRAEFSMFYGLVVDVGTQQSQSCNRETGVAAGRSIDLVLGRQQLADSGVGAALFSRPTLRATLTSSLSDGYSQVVNVDSTNTGWDNSGGFYIGREYCTYTNAEETYFGPVSRGVAGYVHYHTADTASAYAQCTNTPVFWRGRLVTIWEHLVGPDGRFLGERWAELGPYCRQGWRGYVRDAPRPSAGGMVLTCLPLERLAAQEVGAEIGGVMRPDYIVADTSDVVVLTSGNLGNATVPSQPFVDEDGNATGPIIPLTFWAARATADIQLVDTIDATVRIDESAQQVRISIREQETTPVHTDVVVEGRAWFLETGPRAGTWIESTGSVGGYEFVIDLRFGEGVGQWGGAWMVVELDANADFSDAIYAEQGLLSLEAGDQTEIVSYEATKASGQMVAFYVTRRGLSGTTPFNPWLASETRIRVIGGASGSWMGCLRRMLTSTGMGDQAAHGPRGTADVLPLGFGLALPDSWINTSASLGDEIAEAAPIDATAAERTSVEEILGGWLALTRRCLVQRRMPAGDVRLDVVSTDIDDDPQAPTLTDSEVLLDGHDTPEIMSAPNHIRIMAGDDSRPSFVVRDAARAQAEGVVSVRLRAPGISSEQALRLGAEMLSLGDGQAAIRVRLPSWFTGQIGDLYEITTAHPALWDWSLGTSGPSSVFGRIVGHAVDWTTGGQEAVFLLAAQSQERNNLAPTAFVREWASDTVARVDAGDTRGFTVGDACMVYLIGQDTRLAAVTITAIYDGDTYGALTMTIDTVYATIPTAPNAGVAITFDIYANCTTAQRRLMFARTDKEWR